MEAQFAAPPPWRKEKPGAVKVERPVEDPLVADVVQSASVPLEFLNYIFRNFENYDFRNYESYNFRVSENICWISEDFDFGNSESYDFRVSEKYFWGFKL